MANLAIFFIKNKQFLAQGKTASGLLPFVHAPSHVDTIHTFDLTSELRAPSGGVINTLTHSEKEVPSAPSFGSPPRLPASAGCGKGPPQTFATSFEQHATIGACGFEDKRLQNKTQLDRAFRAEYRHSKLNACPPCKVNSAASGGSGEPRATLSGDGIHTQKSRRGRRNVFTTEVRKIKRNIKRTFGRRRARLRPIWAQDPIQAMNMTETIDREEEEANMEHEHQHNERGRMEYSQT